MTETEWHQLKEVRSINGNGKAPEKEVKSVAANGRAPGKGGKVN